MKSTLKFNLIGGLDSTSNAMFTLSSDKLTVAKNVELGYPGALKKRKGCASLGTVGAYTVLGLGELRTTAGVFIPVCGSNQGKLFGMSDLNGTWLDISRTAYSTTSTDRWHFCNAEGYLIGTEGTNIEKYSGSGNATALGGSPPAGAKYPLYMWGYAWLANATSYESFLYYSAYRNIESWDTTTWMIPIDPNDGSVIIGIDKGEQAIYIWKERSLHGLYWTNTLTTAPTFRRQRLYDTGCISQKSIQRTPYGFIWYDGVTVWLWDEKGYPQNISTPIREDLQSVVFNKAYLSTSCWVSSRNQYWLAVPYGSGATENTRVYICTLEDGIPKWSYYDWAVNDFVILHNNGQLVPYKGIAGATGYVHQCLSTELDIAAAISTQAKSKWFGASDFGLNTDELQLEYIRVVVEATGNWDCRVGYELDFGTSGALYSVNQYAGGDLIGSTFIIGSSKIGGGASDLEAERYFRGVNFHHIRIVVENNYAGQPFSIKHIEVGVKAKGVK